MRSVAPSSPYVHGEAERQTSGQAKEISEQDAERLAEIRELEARAGRGELDDEARALYFGQLARLDPEGFRAWYGSRYG